MAVPLALAACVGGDGGVGIRPAPTPEATVPAGGETLGRGDVDVALLLPQSAGGSASGLAEAFRNAAALALDETSTHAIRITIHDTAGTDTGGKQAAETAIAAGAKLVLGPVFSPAVSGAGIAARAAKVPVIAFSTDASVAREGVYLLSFLPRQDAVRIISYAADQDDGDDDIAALVPNNGYGLVMEAAFREAAARFGVTVAAVERYGNQDELGAKARQIATDHGGVDYVFIPNGGSDPKTAAEYLFTNGLDRVSTRLLGSGQWASKDVIDTDIMVGGWYPGPAPQGFEAFSARYQAKYGTAPPRTATLVYDAVMLANGLAQAFGPGEAFTERELTSNQGFLGVDGIFRFSRSGLSERGLAVFLVEPRGETRMISPSPARFARGTF